MTRKYHNQRQETNAWHHDGETQTLTNVMNNIKVKQYSKLYFRHLKRGIQDFHMKYVLVPADKAANNGVVV